MTRGEMRAAVLRNLGRVAASQDEKDDIDRWINQTMREDVCADHLWAGMEQLRTRTTTAGTGTYAYQNATVFKDCAWIALRRTSDDEFVLLTEISELEAYTSFSEQTEGRGLPICFARQAESYLLRPIPDLSTYDIREKVWEYPADITIGSGGDSSTNFILTSWSKLLEFGTTYRACLQYSESEQAVQWLQLYRDELGKAIAVDRRRLAPANLTLKPSLVAGQETSGLPGGTGLWNRRIRGAYS